MGQAEFADGRGKQLPVVYASNFNVLQQHTVIRATATFTVADHENVAHSLLI